LTLIPLVYIDVSKVVQQRLHYPETVSWRKSETLLNYFVNLILWIFRQKK
jgi:hypothetical protein